MQIPGFLIRHITPDKFLSADTGSFVTLGHSAGPGARRSGHPCLCAGVMEKSCLSECLDPSV